MVKKYKIVILVVLLLLLFWFVVHSALIVIDGLNDELEKVDVAVVMGNKVELDGKPSLRLKSRLDKTYELYKEGYFEHVVTTGGVGVEGFDEAKVMRDYLVKAGIPSERIIVDSNGYNTYLTAKNTLMLMDDYHFESVMIISQFHHISRSKLIFSKMGISNVYSAHANFFEARDLYSIFRDFFAFYKYLLKY